MNKADVTEKQEIEEHIKKISQNSTRYNILMTIGTFGSMNIEKLAKMLQKSKSTIHHHIGELLKEPKLLELDTSKTIHTTGTFYQLSEISQPHFNQDPIQNERSQIDEILNSIKKMTTTDLSRLFLYKITTEPNFKYSIESIRNELNFFHVIEKYILYNFCEAEKALKAGLKPVNLDYPIGSFSSMGIEFQLSKIEHMVEISELTAQFFISFEKLKQKILKEIDEAGIPENERIKAHYSFFGGETKEFLFEKDPNFNLTEYVQPIKGKIKEIYKKKTRNTQ